MSRSLIIHFFYDHGRYSYYTLVPYVPVMHYAGNIKYAESGNWLSRRLVWTINVRVQHLFNKIF